eukprot:6801014-Lingulodinium_polyedra.AAC.1
MGNSTQNAELIVQCPEVRRPVVHHPSLRQRVQGPVAIVGPCCWPGDYRQPPGGLHALRHQLAFHQQRGGAEEHGAAWLAGSPR